VDHGYSEQQRQLRDSVRRLLSDRYTLALRNASVAGESGYSATMWRAFADLGLLALPFSEADGGLGGNGVDTLIVMEAFGRGLVVEPFLPTVVLAGGLLRRGGSATQRARFLPALMQGEACYAFAYAEPDGRFNWANVETKATRTVGGYRIDGTKAVVYGAPMAQGLFVTARVGGARLERSGIGVFYIPSDSPGVIRRDYRTIDGFRASEIELSGAMVPDADVIGAPGDAFDLIEAVLDDAAAAVCAEAAGAMAVLMEKTLDYTRMRHAFGQPVAGFQVIQHRLVDMRVACEYASAMAYMAARRLEAPPLDRARAASAAKASVGRDSKFVAQNAVQLHGAIAMTEDLDVGLYFKRLTAIGYQFGNADHHLRRFWSEWRGAGRLPVGVSA
jgi:alkylation response protein AidB-like acyl-CoA dehydrogenase